jgi:hypothetical protein
MQNDALLMKHLDKFYKRANVQWDKLIWGSITIMWFLTLLKKRVLSGGRIFSG